MQPPAPEDMETLNYATWKRLDVTSKRRFGFRVILEALLGVGFLVCICWVIALSVQLKAIKSSAQTPSPECIHALGGGQVGSGGGLHPPAPAYCRNQLAAYADPINGAYWKEVGLAAQNAMVVFGFVNSSLTTASKQVSSGASLPHLLLRQGARSLLGVGASSAAAASTSTSRIATAAPCVTVLSPSLGGPTSQLPGSAASSAGTPAFSKAAEAPAPAAVARAGQQQWQPVSEEPRQEELSSDMSSEQRKLVIFDIDETILSNMQQILSPDKWPWDTWVAAAQAPPLEPMKRFYKALCRAGYSVALVTGRKEVSREATMQNLAAAGYGTQCKAGNVVQLSSGGSSVIDESTACCYDALYMRPKNDTRLASVYKPWARQQLLATGKYKLIALVGDQFSDMNGDYSAPYAFKLPNPFYYIL